MYPLALFLFPLAAAILSLCAGKRAGGVALLASVLYLGLAGSAWLAVCDGGADISDLDWQTTWLLEFGTRLHLRLDPLSALLLLLTALAGPWIVGSALRGGPSKSGIIEPRPSTYQALILFAQAALAGAFLAADALVFYTCWELCMVPIWLLFCWSPHQERGRVALRFFIYTLCGSLLMLAAFIYVHARTGEPGARSFELAAMHAAGAGLSEREQVFVFGALCTAFAIKMPLVPVHGWQPETYFAATAEGRMLLSALLAKLGVYGVIVWLVPMAPAGLAAFGGILVALAVAGAVYGSLLALAQKNLVRTITYASLAHMGLIAAGVFASALVSDGNLTGTSGLYGAALQMLSHSITSIGLFFIADLIERRIGSSDLGIAGALREQAPAFGWLSLVVVLGSIAVPLTSGFWGELLLLRSLFDHAPELAALGTLSMVLGAVYMLRAYQRVMLGEPAVGVPPIAPLSGRELAVLGTLAACVILLGLFPRIVIDAFTVTTPDVALR